MYRDQFGEFVSGCWGLKGLKQKHEKYFQLDVKIFPLCTTGLKFWAMNKRKFGPYKA